MSETPICMIHPSQSAVDLYAIILVFSDVQNVVMQPQLLFIVQQIVKKSKAYTFELTLLGSSDPVVKRTCDVPAWFTFRELHYILQFSMGPWQTAHQHEFSFNKQLQGPRGHINFFPIDEKLRIGQSNVFDNTSGCICYHVPGVPTSHTRVRKEDETAVRLSDVFYPSGRLHDIVAPNGEMYPLVYVYNYQDNWEVELILKGQKLARGERPIFLSLQGFGPLEDSGAVEGWDLVKAAFRVPEHQRTPAQLAKVEWARIASLHGTKFNPDREITAEDLNLPGFWEFHLSIYKTEMKEPGHVRAGPRICRCGLNHDEDDDLDDEDIIPVPPVGYALRPNSTEFYEIPLNTGLFPGQY